MRRHEHSQVAGSEMFDFLPAVFMVMLGRALYRRRSLFDPRLVVVLVKVLQRFVSLKHWFSKEQYCCCIRILEVSLTRTPI